MARVSREFSERFEAFVAGRVASGAYALADVEELREVVRRDLQPGPDTQRGSVDCLMIAGQPVSACIDDADERRRLWEEFLLKRVAR